MKKLFAVVLSALFVVAVAIPALATDARQIALGETGPYIEDDYNIFTWYGTLPSYSNTVWIGLNYEDYYYNLGAPAQDGMGGFQPYIGASYGLGSEGKYGTLAMFFNNNGKPLNWMNDGWDDSGDPFNEFTYSKWNVLYGYAMEKLSFGLYFSRSDHSDEYKWSNTYPSDDTTMAYHFLDATAYTTIGAGVRFDIGEKAYADLAADYSWASQTYKEGDPSYYYYGYGEITADANKMMNFRGRMFYEWNETITLVPYASFGNFDFSLKGDSMKVVSRWFSTDTLDWKDTNYGVKGMGFTFGLGANIKVNENNLLLFAVEPYSYNKIEQSDPPADFVRYDTWNSYYGYWETRDPSSWGRTEEATYTILPAFRLALESDVKDWLTFRIGAVKWFYKSEYKESLTRQYAEVDGEPVLMEEKETDTYIGSYFEYWMGLGFHVGDFDIDAVVNNNLPFRVGYWLTGYSNNYDGPPVYMLSAAYHF